MIKVNWKLSQLNLGRTANGPQFSRMKGWINPLGKKKTWPAEVLAQNKRNMKWVVEEDSYESHMTMWPVVDIKTGIVMSMSFLFDMNMFVYNVP